MAGFLKFPVQFSLALLVCGAGASLAGPPAEDAARLAEGGRFEEAAGKFREAIRSDPENSSLHLGLGLTLKSLKKYPEAIRSLEAARRLDPKSPEPLYSLGLIYEAAAVDPELIGKSKGRQSADRYRDKAREVWKKLIRLGAKPELIEVARDHLERLEETLSE